MMLRSLRRSSPLPFVLLLALAAVLPASADDGVRRAEEFRQAQDPLRDRAWAEAVDALEAFRERHPDTEEATEAWVLESRALLLAGRPADALASTTAFLEAHGEEAWAGRMKHNAADAYAALGRPGEAAETLRERVEATTTAEARAAIGARHVELADRDFDGVETTDDLGRKRTVRNVARALESYEHALAIGVPAGETLRVRTRIAKAYEELNKPAEAATRYQALLDEAAAGTIEADAMQRAAWQVALGRSRLASGDRDGARAVLREALAAKPAPDLRLEALLLLADERLQASKAGGGDAAFDEGVTLLRRAIIEHKDDPRAVEAQKKLAQAYEAAGRALEAAAEWSSLIERFPDDAFVPEARDRMARALLAAGHFDEAIQAWERFLAAHPNDPSWPEVRARIVEASFLEGAARLAQDDREGAVRAWRAFAERYPTDPRAPDALVRAGLALRTADDAEGALALWRQVEGRYATSDQAPQALFLIGETLDTRLGRLDEAVQTYETLVNKHGGSPYAQQAAARLARLKEKELELTMERVVGSAAAKVVKVRTRNIDTLQVRVYRLDLEEYFRRKGTVAGVENLQLEVVKPDLEAAWKVDPYRPFELFEAEREVPVEERGAYVVVAGDEDLTATLLFLVSDLEVVTKMDDGRDLFVWAFQRKDQGPVAGARVITGLPGKREATYDAGTTGADGVFHDRRARYRNGTSVLVASDAGFAVAGFGNGPANARGFQSKAYVYTDRPIYRPGQEVAWRGIFLRASGGAYEAPRPRKGTARIRDARGQVVSERELTSSRFGSFDGSYVLDGSAALGVWKVELSVPREGTWTGEFEVQEYRKPELTVEVRPVRPVYLTGEKAEVVAQVRYAFGGPVANAPLRYAIYRIPTTFTPSDADDYSWYVQSERDDRETRKSAGGGTLVQRGELTTGADGNARIAFETADLDEDALYRIQVAVEDVTRRWIYDEGRIPVTRRDHMAVVRADRQVYRPKQEVRVEVRTVDALERPVARSGEVELLELRRAPDDPAALRRGLAVPVREEEVRVASYPLSTGSDGRAELRLELPRPGRWRIRWKATDGRGALVTAHTDVEASGETEDPTRHARLVAARTLVPEGDAADVLLRSPIHDVKALLTYEASGVLEYRFVDIQGTSTMLELPVTARDAPNVFFKVAIPGPRELFEAETEVVVLRYLDVVVRVPATAKPGEKVTVKLETTDARGNAVPAEVSVALVDETLYALAPDRAPQIRPYFYDQRRTNAVQTTSSLGFRVEGTTRATNKDLLADEAVRSGDAGRALARAALDDARAALERGDVAASVTLALRAAEADPGSFEARTFLDELGALEGSRGERARVLLAESAPAQLGARVAELEALVAQARASYGAPAPAARPALEEDAKRLDREAEEPVADAMEVDEELADAPFEKANELIGLGGGAGGAFRGRGGSRTMTRAGGAVARSTTANFKGPVSNPSPGTVWAAKDLPGTAKAFGFDLGLEIETRERFADTALWDPRVVTGEDGRGTVEVELPDNLTTWRAVVRGLSGQALVGEGRGRLEARKDLHVRLDTPRFLVQGDEVTVPVAVHNDTGERQDVAVGLTAEGVRLSGEDATLDLGADAIGVSDRDAASEHPGTVRFEATAVAGGYSDRTGIAFPALPRGIRVVEGATGLVDVARGETQESFLVVPEGAIDGATRLAMVLYPGIDSAILDALLSLDLFPYGCIEQTVHRFLPALEAREALLAAGSPEATRLENLDEAIRRGAIRVKNLQNGDGSFGWFRGSGGDVAMTAYALMGLEGARKAGVGDLDAAIEQAVQALARLLRAGGADEDRRALGHLALARAGRIDAESWATTFRRRNDELSVSGLAWLAMAATELGRAFDRDELVRLLVARRIDDGTLTHWSGRKGDCFVGSDREATALAVQALLAAGVPDAHAERGLEWLLANPRHGGFGTTKETAAFVGAASAWVRLHGAQGYGGALELLLDGRSVRRIEIGAKGLGAADRRFLVPEAASWAAGRHRVGFRLSGEGRLRWAARLDAVVASDDLPADEQGLRVARTYLRYEEAPVEGEPPPFKPGYDVLRPAARPRIEARALEAVNAGDRVVVRIELEADRDLEYVMVEDPLPAGFDVLEATAEGGFAWQERRDDRQVFFLTRVPKGPLVLRYVLQAVHWGRFTALGTTAAPMYFPQVHGRAAGATLRVAREDLRGTDAEHPPTPDEVYARAQRLFADGSPDEAVRLFRELRDGQPLRDEIVEVIEARLLEHAVDRKDAREIVRAREALLRRNPARIPDDWETARRIAFAYHELGEVEVASGLYRDLVARAFGLRTDWMRTLAARDREVEGLDDLGLALRAFPIANATAEAALRRALRYPELPRPKGRALDAGRPMDAEGLDALWSWTAHFAETPFADPANYALIGALRSSGDLAGAEGAAEAFLRRFPKSVHEDDAWYFLADSRYRTFERSPSEEGAEKVDAAARPLVERNFPVRDGETRISEFRPQAYHILARVQHVLGHLDAAVKLYWEARTIEDAREAHAFLTEERLRLPATHVLPVAGGASVPFEYQNVGTVELKAYPVDLQVLFAVRRTLAGLNEVDLSGIRPQHAWTATFADGRDHLPHEGTVDLPVAADAPGVWLVVAKAGTSESKALVLKTDLDAEVQGVGEKARVYVTDAAGAPVGGAYVVVSDGTRIRARGLTDGRGVLEAPGVGTKVFVVVSKDDRAAVAR